MFWIRCIRLSMMPRTHTYSISRTIRLRLLLLDTSAGAQLHVAISFQSRHTVYTTTNVCTRYCSGVDSFFYLVIAFTSDNTSIRTAKNFGSSLFPLQFLTDRFVVNYIENQIAELLLYLRTQQQQYNHKSFASISLCATNSRSSRRSSKRRNWKRPKQEHLYML